MTQGNHRGQCWVMFERGNAYPFHAGCLGCLAMAQKVNAIATRRQKQAK